MFIVFEGPDGSGKTTQLNMMKTFLEKEGISVVATREPGGTPLGEDIRNLLLDRSSKIDDLTEVLLFQASRRQHLVEVLLPALDANKVVLCDRYTPSTFAYQHGGSGVSYNLIKSLNTVATNGLAPDLCYIFTCPVKVSLKRKYGDDITRFEDKDINYHRRVLFNYEYLATQHFNYVKVPTTRSKELVFSDVRDIFERTYAELNNWSDYTRTELYTHLRRTFCG